MKVIYGFKKIKKYPRPVVTLGVFDGVHRAHRYILRYAASQAQRIKGTSMVITFWPHPQQEESLYSLKHRIRLIDELGIDVCVVLRFNRGLAQTKAEDFIKNILITKIGCHYLCVGRNFLFGRDREGDYKLLRRLSLKYNFKLNIFDVLKTNRRSISSTYIRRLINQGKLKKAQGLLLRPVSILGTVIKGGSLARRLGFPTANINPHHEVLPPCGVYAVAVIFNHKKFKAICYIGSKPTFNFSGKKQVEVHIFNFAKNIYHQDLEIQFLRKIREEQRFASQFLLCRQVKKDIAQAKRIFSSP